MSAKPIVMSQNYENLPNYQAWKAGTARMKALGLPTQPFNPNLSYGATNWSGGSSFVNKIANVTGSIGNSVGQVFTNPKKANFGQILTVGSMAAIPIAGGLGAFGGSGGTTMGIESGAPQNLTQLSTDWNQAADAIGNSSSLATAGSGGSFLSSLGSDLSSAGSAIWSGVKGAGGIIGGLLAGNKSGGSMSGSSLLKYLKEGYGYVSGHGGLLGMAGSGLESAGSGLYSGTGQVFNGIGKGVQYAGGFLGGSSTQQALQGLSIKNLGSEVKSLFSSNQKISGLQSQLSLAKMKGLIASFEAKNASTQPQYAPQQASAPVIVNSPSPSAPIQAGFGGSTMEILLFVGVAMGMFLFMRGKK